jgi:hypothetical protein
MTRPALRWDNPRTGGEGFDERAGIEWECGIDPNDTADSIPDVPWNKYRSTLEPPNRLLFDNGQWAITAFGLELLSDMQERYDRYRIPACNLLNMYARAPVYAWPVIVAKEPWVVFDAFEEAFRKALEYHFCPRRLPPRNLQQAVAEHYGRPPCYESSLVDNDVLERTLRRARAIARRRRTLRGGASRGPRGA